MLQQTPVARVEQPWLRWMSEWPTPAALATVAPGDAVHAWGRLGYPRRALRLHGAAVAMVQRHNGLPPDTYDDLIALPGVGTYTAAAVAAFAFGQRIAVVDTNVRRVLARILHGVGQAAPSVSRAELDLAGSLLPVHDLCAWQRAGRPAYAGPVRRPQSWQGTDRQCRGAILAVLRETDGPVAASALGAAWSNGDAQRDRCLDSLIADGLVEPLSRNEFRLPGR